jgi:hypothetical protein
MFQVTNEDILVWLLSLCLEGFLYGKISVLCALTCTLAKEVQLQVKLFPRSGLYSGIFAIYLQCQSNNPTGRTAIILYALCFLYVLSAVNFVADFVYLTPNVSNNSICKNIIFLTAVQSYVVYRFYYYHWHFKFPQFNINSSKDTD